MVECLGSGHWWQLYAQRFHLLQRVFDSLVENNSDIYINYYNVALSFIPQNVSMFMQILEAVSTNRIIVYVVLAF
jgi:hypothetical protein